MRQFLVRTLNDILASQACDGAFHDRGAGGPLADFGRNIRSERRARSAGPSCRESAGRARRQPAERDGRVQLDCQNPVQRPIEDRIASRVDEIGENDDGLRRELGAAEEAASGAEGEVTPDSERVARRRAGGCRRELPLQLGGGLPPALPDLLPDTGLRSSPAFATRASSAERRPARRSAFRRGRSRTSRYPSGHRPVCPPAAPAPCRQACPSPCGFAVTVSSCPDFASPKSRTLTPDFAIMMLPGLRSR